MDVETLIKPAVDWTGQRWLDRIDQSASLLYVHDYITARQREAITAKLEKQMKDGLAKGLIVEQEPAHD